MGAWQAYRLRMKRRRLLWRAFRSRRRLAPIANRTALAAPDAILLFATVFNERNRLPYFLDYYRRLGIGHFLIVNNASTDGSGDYLACQPDVSLWQTDASYRHARFGMDWIGWLQIRYGHNRWNLVVDADEFLVYPFCDSRPLRALTDWLDSIGARSFPAMLLDMYPKGPVGSEPYHEGQNPFDIAAWFDSGNYTHSLNGRYGNLWIQGGPRARTYFRDAPWQAPALNKIPLVRWNRRFVYAGSTHMLLPRRLNIVYEEWGGERISGCLLHAKFLGDFAEKAAVEMTRQQHYADSVEYRAYDGSRTAPADLWCRWSEKYESWRQLERLGLMSSGNWA